VAAATQAHQHGRHTTGTTTKGTTNACDDRAAGSLHTFRPWLVARR